MENDDQLSRWTEDRLRTLDPVWQPDLGRARALLEQKRNQNRPPETHAKIYVCVTAITIIAVAWVWISQRPQATLPGPDVIYIPPQDRKPAPDFTLRDTSGQSVRLSSERGKVVVLNFWATWCEPCKAEVPWFVQFEKGRRNAGFEVLGVALDADGAKAVQPWLKSNKVNYRILMGNEEVTDLFGGVMTLPATVVIDRSGHIAAIQAGMYKRNEINAVLSEVIAPERQFQR